MIKAGLKLSAKGKQMIQASLSKQETEKTIDRDMGGWIWGHEDAAATGKKYDYVQQPSRPGGTGTTGRR